MAVPRNFNSVSTIQTSGLSDIARGLISLNSDLLVRTATQSDIDIFELYSPVDARTQTADSSMFVQRRMNSSASISTSNQSAVFREIEFGSVVGVQSSTTVPTMNKENRLLSSSVLQSATTNADANVSRRFLESASNVSTSLSDSVVLVERKFSSISDVIASAESILRNERRFLDSNPNMSMNSTDVGCHVERRLESALDIDTSTVHLQKMIVERNLSSTAEISVIANKTSISKTNLFGSGVNIYMVLTPIEVDNLEITVLLDTIFEKADDILGFIEA